MVDSSILFAVTILIALRLSSGFLSHPTRFSPSQAMGGMPQQVLTYSRRTTKSTVLMALATDRLIKIDESHSRYSMTEMLSHKLLTKAEEATLSRQYKLGQIIKRQIADLQESLGHKPSDAELEEYLNLTYHDVDQLIQKSERAKHHLISSNMKLVLSIAQRKQHLGLSHPDLVFEGVRGLQKAVEGFDPERGYRFGTYSTLIINQMIHKALDDHSRIVRVPLQFTKICRTVTKEQNDFVEEHGRQPTYEELSEICKLSIHDVKLVFKSLEKILSVESKLVSNKMSTKNQDKGQALIRDTLHSVGTDTEYVKTDRQRDEHHIELLTALHGGGKLGLTKQEAAVLQLRYRLGEGESTKRLRSYRRVGELISENTTSPQGIRLIEMRALKKLRGSLQEKETASALKEMFVRMPEYDSPNMQLSEFDMAYMS